MKQIIWIVVIFLLVAGCSSPASSPANEVQIAVALTQTEASIIQQSTNSVSPTETPKPTQLPTEPNNDVEIQEYSSKVSQIMASISDDLTTMQTYAELFGSNTNLFFDEEFKQSYFNIMDNIYDNLVEVSNLTPPLILSSSHEYLVKAKDEFYMVRMLQKSGLSNIDADDINSSVDHLTNFSGYIQLATSELEKITK